MRLVERFDITAAVQVPLGEEAPLPGIPGLALRRERAPNLAGARLLGYSATWESALAAAAGASLVVVLDAEIGPAEEAALAAAPGVVVVLGTVATDSIQRADLVLPVTNMAEENGTYLNRDRRLQRFDQAKSQPGMARPAWWVAGEVLAGPGPDADAPSTAEEAFLLLGERWPLFGGIRYGDIGFTGRILTAAPAAPAAR
jgi:hypothetical protein